MVLGHITYSNCFPVHAGVLERPPTWLEIRRGVPTELNEALAVGEIDVAPASSIEYARRSGRYRVLPGLAIASDGPVGSILMETTVPAESLGQQVVALPTASATSVVLLRALLELRNGVQPSYTWFRQSPGADPVGEGAAAALWIGDVALRRDRRPGLHYLDLGEVWREWTGLPFVYALWQTPLGPERNDELDRLAGVLAASRAFFVGHAETLAAREGPGFSMDADRLLTYWRSLSYTLDQRALEGLLRFYAMATELGEAEAVSTIRLTEPG